MNININTGKITLTINNDENRRISFNPEDIEFTEKFYNLLVEFKAKNSEYIKRAEAIENNTESDEDGLPSNIDELMQLSREVCVYIRGQIDHVFGAGTSETAFENANSVDMFTQFFEGITPFIQKSREDKIAKYKTTPQFKGKHVMK